jgi:uncharacterized membrane protein YdjX (TVP38/TMEM64 family)
MTEPTGVARFERSLPWLGGAIVVVALLLLWIPFSHVGANPAEVRAWMEQAGPLAPLAFFALNVVQIVVAPIPGYPVQVLGGILFGVVFGSIITVGGMVAGGVLAAWLGRRLGRPWLARRLGEDKLQAWSNAAHVNSFWTWWVILLIPLGDIPYFLAGLSGIRLSVFALAILASRGPFTVLIVWAGDSVVDLPVMWVALLMAAIGVVVIIGFSQAGRLERWGRAYVGRQGSDTVTEEPAANAINDDPAGSDKGTTASADVSPKNKP